MTRTKTQSLGERSVVHVGDLQGLTLSEAITPLDRQVNIEKTLDAVMFHESCEDKARLSLGAEKILLWKALSAFDRPILGRNP